MDDFKYNTKQQALDGALEDILESHEADSSLTDANPEAQEKVSVLDRLAMPSTYEQVRAVSESTKVSSSYFAEDRVRQRMRDHRESRHGLVDRFVKDHKG